MYKLAIPKQDLWDEGREKFIPIDSEVLELEHSLVSLDKWESKWCIPWLSRQPKTREQRIDYIRCMTLNEISNDNVYLAITNSQLKEVDEYINRKMTATTFKQSKEKHGSKFVTAELIYYWMSSFNIPYMPCQNWHLNKLLTLIKVCSEEQKGPQKQSRREALEEQHRLNQERRAKYNTKG